MSKPPKIHFSRETLDIFMKLEGSIAKLTRIRMDAIEKALRMGLTNLFGFMPDGKEISLHMRHQIFPDGKEFWLWDETLVASLTPKNLGLTLHHL